MKYAHLADLHIGGWRDERLRDLTTKIFNAAIDRCVAEKVDFILFAGDLFNTALPAIDKLKIVTKKLKELKDKDIPLYIIAGSHDFSPSGKTMLDVLEKAGLLINVCKGKVDENNRLHLKFTIDVKTGVKITGMLGKKGMLDSRYYESLVKEELEKKEGYKIFMFHTTLSELKPKHLENMEGQPLSLLPKNFDYYAGGHVHHPTIRKEPEYGTIAYTGALFPNNFSELEKYSFGGFYLIENNKVDYVPIKLKNHVILKINANQKTPNEVENEVIFSLKKNTLDDSIITLRITGQLIEGKISDINWRNIEHTTNNCFILLRNTSRLTTKDFEEVKIETENVEEIEDRLIKENLPENTEIVKRLLQALYTEKREGETNFDFEKRIKEEGERLLE